MAEDQLSTRFEEIRERFASKLDAHLDEADSALPHLSGEGTSAIDAISETYRRFHQICGTGGTLGFKLLGQAAGEAETILRQPFNERRALTDIEVAMLKQAIEALRAAARIDMPSTKIARGYKS